MSTPDLRTVPTPDASDCDALVFVAPSPLLEHARHAGHAGQRAIEAAARIDNQLARPRPPAVLAAEGAPGGRVIVAVTPSLKDELDDVRVVAEACRDATARAVDAGATKPLLVIGAPTTGRYRFSREVGALAALGSQWQPLEAREAGRAPRTAESLTVVGLDGLARVRAVEAGRVLCRDITGTDPERMAPRKAAALCEEAFANTGITVTVEHDVSRYPLLASVARASQVVERHRPAVVRLEYVPEGPVTRTFYLAGKGVTYDTGGADLKTEGAMAGMSRDKGGAGAVAGVLRALAHLKPKGLRVVGLLGFVRNSIGEESYVTDEIVTARSGVRVRIGNTDAEGRLVLADLLAAAKELAKNDSTATLMSLATLTGHVYRAYGPYTGAIGNGAVKTTLDRYQDHGESWGELVERSFARREDYAFVAARTAAEDVVSSNRLPSVSTPRGHQFPFAFLDVAAGLRGTGIPFAHIDIGGVAVENADWQFGRPTGFPVAALTALLCDES